MAVGAKYGRREIGALYHGAATQVATRAKRTGQMYPVNTRVRQAFTLLEIVISIGIIVIVFALLLPAVQHSREAARRMACASQLRQIAMGMHSHEAVQRHLPSGGWGWRWTG